MGGIFVSSQHQRLRWIKCFAALTVLYGFFTFVTSLTIFDWACKLDTMPDKDGINCGVEDNDGIFTCHGQQAWKQIAIFGIMSSVYQMISSTFLFQGRLGMRSWIIGNILMGIFSVFFSWFITNKWPNVMIVYLFNFVLLVFFSVLGYFVKNMSSFDESSMSLLM